MDVYIVILGARVGEDGRPSPALRRRIAKGAALAQDMPDVTVIGSGGGANGARSEAATIRDQLIEAGVSGDRIVCESRSRDTFENILFTRAALAQGGGARVLIVTDSYHMPRALLTCWWLGLPAVGDRSGAMAPGPIVGFWPICGNFWLCRFR